MASNIDPTVIKDDQPVDKADLREQFQIAASEITELQRRVAVAGQMAFNVTDSTFDNI